MNAVRITLRPLADGVPAEVRLRRALKCLLRSFRLRCDTVEYAEPRPAELHGIQHTYGSHGRERFVAEPAATH